MAVDYYKILSLSRNASDADINKAYHRQVRLWRSRLNAPDFQLRQEAKRKLEELDAAKKVLLNTKKYNFNKPKSPKRPSPKHKKELHPSLQAIAHIGRIFTKIFLFIIKQIWHLFLIVLKVFSLIAGFCGFVLFVVGIYQNQFDTALSGMGVNYFWMSIPTFIEYSDDKKAARRNNRRTPEKKLHTLELCGGWIGAIFAQKLIHHKNKKATYLKVYWLIAFFHLSLIIYFIPAILPWVIPQKYILIFNAILLIISLDAIKKKGNFD